MIFRGIPPKEWIKAYPNLYHPKEKRTKEESVAEAKRLTGVSYEHINALIKSGKQTKDGWTFDETFGYGDEDETE